MPFKKIRFQEIATQFLDTQVPTDKLKALESELAEMIDSAQEENKVSVLMAALGGNTPKDCRANFGSSVELDFLGYALLQVSGFTLVSKLKSIFDKETDSGWFKKDNVQPLYARHSSAFNFLALAQKYFQAKRPADAQAAEKDLLQFLSQVTQSEWESVAEALRLKYTVDKSYAHALLNSSSTTLFLPLLQLCDKVRLEITYTPGYIEILKTAKESFYGKFTSSEEAYYKKLSRSLKKEDVPARKIGFLEQASQMKTAIGDSFNQGFHGEEKASTLNEAAPVSLDPSAAQLMDLAKQYLAGKDGTLAPQIVTLLKERTHKEGKAFESVLRTSHSQESKKDTSLFYALLEKSSADLFLQLLHTADDLCLVLNMGTVLQNAVSKGVDTRPEYLHVRDSLWARSRKAEGDKQTSALLNGVQSMGAAARVVSDAAETVAAAAAPVVNAVHTAAMMGIAATPAILSTAQNVVGGIVDGAIIAGQMTQLAVDAAATAINIMSASAASLASTVSSTLPLPAPQPQQQTSLDQEVSRPNPPPLPKRPRMVRKKKPSFSRFASTSTTGDAKRDPADLALEQRLQQQQPTQPSAPTHQKEQPRVNLSNLPAGYSATITEPFIERVKKVLVDHFDHNHNALRWFFGILSTAFVLALCFSPLGPIVFAGLPLVGAALLAAAQWTASCIGGYFAAAGIAVAAGWIVANIERVVAHALHFVITLGKGLLSFLAHPLVYAALHLNAWANDKKIENIDDDGEVEYENDADIHPILRFLSGAALTIILLPALLLSGLAKTFEQLRQIKILHRLVMFYRNPAEKAEKLNVPDKTTINGLLYESIEGGKLGSVLSCLSHDTGCYLRETTKDLPTVNVRNIEPAPTCKI